MEGFAPSNEFCIHSGSQYLDLRDHSILQKKIYQHINGDATFNS